MASGRWLTHIYGVNVSVGHKKGLYFARLGFLKDQGKGTSLSFGVSDAADDLHTPYVR